MRGRASFSVRGDKIRVRCVECKKVRHYAVQQNMRHKIVRCHCGKTQRCTLEYRQERRESCALKAEVILHSGERIQVHLCNTSIRGLSFTKRGRMRSFRVGQNLIIEHRANNGKKGTRRVCVANVSADRVGVRYTDIPNF